MTTEDTNPTPEPTPVVETVAPDAPAPAAEHVVTREVVTPAPVASSRGPRTLGIAGGVLGAVLLLVAGFAIGHWAFPNHHHGGGPRMQQARGQRMRGPGQRVVPNRQGNNNNQPGNNNQQNGTNRNGGKQQGNNTPPGSNNGQNNQHGSNNRGQGLNRAMPNLQQLRAFLQGLLGNRGAGSSNSQGGSGSSSSVSSQLQQLQSQVQQLQKQVQQLQTQLKANSP